MADRQTNWQNSPHTRLRNANNTLLHSLKQGQKEIRSILKEMQSQRPLYSTFDHDKTETSFTARGLDRTPTTVHRSEKTKEYLQDADASTPKSYKDALVGPGNDRRSRSLEATPNSILRKSSNKSRKTPKKGLRVSFQTDENSNTVYNDLNNRSMLGYDWIAGILDNTSYLAEKNDDFFEDLKEFRRVNKDECYSSNLQKTSLIQPFHHTTPKKDIAGEDGDDSKPYTCTNTYRLNERLFAEKVHNDDESCGVCYTKPPPEYETEDSYVRVSVPRSTLMSPYKVKPHRRVSFDPTDSIGLSSHCLAGWESSKPAVIPPQASLDLKTSLYKTKDTLNSSKTFRCLSVPQNTRDLLDRSHSMRYGLQVLDMQRASSDRQAHSTSYPLL